MNSKKKILVGTVAFMAFVLIGIATYLVLPKSVTLVIDNDVQNIKTGYIFTNELINNYISGEAKKDYIVVSESSNLDLVALTSSIEVKTKKEIQLTIGTEVSTVSTFAVTAKELFEELNLKDEENKKYVLASLEDMVLVDHAEVNIICVNTETKEETIEEYLDVIYKNNSSLYVGTNNVTVSAVPKKTLNVYNITYENGNEVSKVLVSSTVVQEGVAKVVEKGTKVYVPSTVTLSGDTSVWDQLAQCESGGNWYINNGNGYYGGLQFSAATWRTAASAVGVSASYAHQASREEQILAASWLQKQYGWGQWPACSRQLGL